MTERDDQFTIHISKRVKRLLVSAFLLFHCGAMMSAPFPQNRIRNSIYPPFEAYLHLLYMENYWQFFAPGPLFGRRVSYELEVIGGRTVEVALTDKIDKDDPNFFRISAIFDKTTKDFPDYVHSYALHVCKMSKQDRPVRVRFISRKQKFLTEALYRVGRRPSEADFTETDELDWIACPGDPS